MTNELFREFAQILLDQTSDGIVLADQNGLILQANRAFANFHACNAADLMGKSMWSVLPSEQQEKSRAHFFEMLSSWNSGASFETIIPSKSESSILLETMVYFSEPVGERTKMLALVRDVTEKRNKQRRHILQSEMDALKAQFEQLLKAQKQVEKDLRDSQAELRKSQQLFESIAKNFPSGAITVLDKAYRIIFADGEEYRKQNLDPSTFIGQPIDVLFPNQDLAPAKALYDKVFQGETHHFELENSEKFYENIAVPLPDEKGNIHQILFVTLNITERKRLEAALRELNESLERQVQERTAELRESQNLYRAIAENYPNGMVGIYNRSFVILFTDGMEYQRLGIDAANLIDRSLFEVYPEHIAPLIASYFNRAFNGETLNFELSLGGSDYFYFVSPIRTETDVIEQILVVTQNIMERKEADRLLRENEERYRLVLEQTEQLVYDVDLPTGKIKWSGAIEKLTGYLPSEYHISLSEWAAEIHPDDRDAATSQLKETIKSGAPYRVEYRYRRKDGSYFWVEDNGVYLKDRAGKPIRMLGAMKDSTLQKNMEIEKKRITEKAIQAQKLEAIGTLASGIAHEFNNLLAIISLANEQMQMNTKNEEILKNTQTIQKIVVRGKHIARQMLDFSRSEQTEKQPIELSRLINEITTTLRRLLKKNITVQAVQFVEQAWIMGNDKQLYQVLLNLGINADDAMPNGGILSYGLSISRYNGKLYAVVRVQDTGTGIAPEVKARMFEPFFTTKSVGKGTGLGLSIVHGIVKAHDGQIEVETELGKGTTFTLIFPILELSKVTESEEVNTSEVSGEETLLIVEDELFMKTILAKMLRAKGYRVLEATDGEEALTIFEEKKQQIDLVLTDMGMPNMDGYELLKRLRRIKENLKVVVMTGYMDSEQTEKLAKEQIDIVSKPFDMAEMSAVIRNVLMR
jgi:PAS domain S-box-containing protein